MTKIAIVTGGTRGIGASISKKLKSSNSFDLRSFTNFSVILCLSVVVVVRKVCVAPAAICWTFL